MLFARCDREVEHSQWFLTVKQGVLHKINLYEFPAQMAEGPMKSPSEECLAIDGYRGEDSNVALTRLSGF